MERLESDYREMDWREGEMEGSQEPLMQQDRGAHTCHGGSCVNVLNSARAVATWVDEGSLLV